MLMDLKNAKLLSTRQLARRLGVSQEWIREEAATGRLPCLPAGQKGKNPEYLFNLDAVEETLLRRAAE